MRARIIALALVFTVFTIAPSHAYTVPVFDFAGFANTLLTAWNTFYSYAEDIQHTANQVQQIALATQDVANNGIDMNTVDTVLGLAGRMNTTLKNARGLSYETDQAIRDFEVAYKQVKEVLTPAQALAQRAQWATTRRSAAGAAIQVQAISRDLEQTHRSMERLLSKAKAADGSVKIAQAQAQLQALSQSIELQQVQQQAVLGRLQALKEAESATAALQELEAGERFFAPMATYTGARGKAFNLR